MTLDSSIKKNLTEHLSTFVTDNKKIKIEEALNQRTRYLTVGLENIYQAHNASAALRSCECFGVQDIHIIEKDHIFSPSKDIVKGSAKWLSIHKHSYADANNLKDCVNNLKVSGYKILATTLQGKSLPIQNIKLDQKIALFFGTEGEGLSAEMHGLADEFVHIPMVGFTQSLNLSVCVALCLFEITQRLRKENIAWQLSEAEKTDLRIDWYTNVIQNGEIVVREFLRIIKT